MRKTKSVTDVRVLLIFGNQVELTTEVAAGGMRGRRHGNCTAIAIDGVVLSCEPKIVEDFG